MAALKLVLHAGEYESLNVVPPLGPVDLVMRSRKSAPTGHPHRSPGQRPGKTATREMRAESAPQPIAGQHVEVPIQCTPYSRFFTQGAALGYDDTARVFLHIHESQYT